jgi:hypothetical protein
MGRQGGYALLVWRVAVFFMLWRICIVSHQALAESKVELRFMTWLDPGCEAGHVSTRQHNKEGVVGRSDVVAYHP